MIKSVRTCPISQIFDLKASRIYQIPKYQREYTWTQNQWDDLFNDIIDNDKEYFLGTTIVIDQTDNHHDMTHLELVDGQQRLTTLSLLLAAIYKHLSTYQNDMSDEQRAEFFNLKHQLIIKEEPGQTRIKLQNQNNNFEDYNAKFFEIGLLKENVRNIKGSDKRHIYKAFNYFENLIKKYIGKDTDEINKINAIVSKINSAVLVEITVFNHSDAYTLFGSLNMRGTPLTAIDFIKNTLLAKSANKGSTGSGSIEKSFEKWKELLGYIGDNYNLQDRFFRHYYNAFKDNLNEPFKRKKPKASLGSIATSGNILKIYKELIEHDYENFLQDILECGKIYSYILNNNKEDEKYYQEELLNLDRIQGSPSYLLLLNLIKNQEELEIDDKLMNDIVKLLVKFFVRRNLTDNPGTRNLTRIFMEIVSGLSGKKGSQIYELIKDKLTEVSANKDVFKDILNGDIYEINRETTRFILCYIAEQHMTKETHRDLWKLDNNKKYIWTIEHIFPQGKNIPKEWIDMVAGGKKKLAEEHQSKYVHKLGNLTLSGYNSTLSNKSYIEKRDRIDKKGRLIGYNNGFKLNEKLVTYNEWTIDHIVDRTNELVKEAVELFDF